VQIRRWIVSLLLLLLVLFVSACGAFWVIEIYPRHGLHPPLKLARGILAIQHARIYSSGPPFYPPNGIPFYVKAAIPAWIRLLILQPVTPEAVRRNLSSGADLTILSADPAQDLANLARVQMVTRSGRVLWERK
jgi:hypothetical protein